MNEVLWQWDNARPHSSHTVQEFLETRQITTVFQSPYIPDFNLCDFFLFSWMKADFANTAFSDHLEVWEAALQWARGLDIEAIKREVQKLVDHCQTVIDARGEYVTP